MTGRWVVAAVAIVGGLVVVWQLRVYDSVTVLATAEQLARQSIEVNELLKVRAKLERQAVELKAQLTTLSVSSQQAQAGQQQADAQRRTNDVVLARVAVTGPGIRITFAEQAVAATAVIDLVNALKNLGAEALGVNGQRFGPTSSIDDGTFAPPLVIETIGNAQLLDEGLRQSGGVLSRLSVPASVERLETLTLSAR